MKTHYLASPDNTNKPPGSISTTARCRLSKSSLCASSIVAPLSNDRIIVTCPLLGISTWKGKPAHAVVRACKRSSVVEDEYCAYCLPNMMALPQSCTATAGIQGALLVNSMSMMHGYANESTKTKQPVLHCGMLQRATRDYVGLRGTAHAGAALCTYQQCSAFRRLHSRCYTSASSSAAARCQPRRTLPMSPGSVL